MMNKFISIILFLSMESLLIDVPAVEGSLRATPVVDKVVDLVSELTQLVNNTKHPNNSAEFSWSLSDSLSNILYRSDCLYDLGLYIKQQVVKPVHYAELNRVFREFSLLLEPLDMKELGIEISGRHLADVISSSEDINSLFNGALIFSLLDITPIDKERGIKRFVTSVSNKMLNNKPLTRLINSLTIRARSTYTSANDNGTAILKTTNMNEKRNKNILNEWVWMSKCDMSMINLFYSRITWLCTAGVMIEEIYMGLAKQEDKEADYVNQLGAAPRKVSLKLIYKSMSELHEKCWSQNFKRDISDSYIISSSIKCSRTGANSALRHTLSKYLILIVSITITASFI